MYLHSNPHSGLEEEVVSADLQYWRLPHHSLKGTAFGMPSQAPGDAPYLMQFRIGLEHHVAQDEHARLKYTLKENV